MEKQNSLTTIDEYYQTVCNTPLAVFKDTPALKDLSTISTSDIEYLAGASLPTSLHNLLLLARQITTVSEADSYLAQIKQLIKTVDTTVSHIFFILNYLFLYSKLIKKDSDSEQYKLFALCLLCFDYNRCVT